MATSSIRVIVLTQGNATKLIQALSRVDGIEIASVFVERPRVKHRTFSETIRRSIKYDGMFATIIKFFRIIIGLPSKGQRELNEVFERQSTLESFLRDGQIKYTVVDDFHSETSLREMKAVAPDLGILYGTNIVKEVVFNIPRFGSINLHQGLAPYYRGGPTVFWELYNNENKIGITVHFVASKVDTGDIIVQRILPLHYDFATYGLDFDSYIDDFRRSLTEPSIELVVLAVEQILIGNAPRIVQQTELGKRYRLPTYKQRNELRRKLFKRFSGQGANSGEASSQSVVL